MSQGPVGREEVAAALGLALSPGLGVVRSEEELHHHPHPQMQEPEQRDPKDPKWKPDSFVRVLTF